MPAHRVADERDLPEAERVDEAQEVRREVLGRVGRRLRPLALAVAALIERDHVKPIRERGRDAVEPVSVRGAAVEEAEGRTAGVSPLEEAQRELADDDGTFARGPASQAWNR